MLELELPPRRLLHCRMEFVKPLCYHRFLSLSTQTACLQFLKVVILNRLSVDSKTFRSFIATLLNMEHSLLHIEEGQRIQSL